MYGSFDNVSDGAHYKLIRKEQQLVDMSSSNE
jgi:hypothetical protein